MNQKFFSPKNIARWAVIDFSLNKARARANTERFVTMLVDCCQQLGMRFCPHLCFILTRLHLRNEYVLLLVTI